MLIAFSSSAMTTERGASEERWCIDSLGKWSCVSWLIHFDLGYTNNASHLEYIFASFRFHQNLLILFSFFFHDARYFYSSFFFGTSYPLQNSINVWEFEYIPKIISKINIVKFIFIPCSYIYNLSQKSPPPFSNGIYRSKATRNAVGLVVNVREGHVVEGRSLSILLEITAVVVSSLDPRRSLCSPLQSWNSSASGCCGSFIIPRNGIHITGTPFIHHVSEARPDGFIRLYPDPWASTSDLYFNRFLSFRARALLNPLPRESARGRRGIRHSTGSGR